PSGWFPRRRHDDLRPGRLSVARLAVRRSHRSGDRGAGRAADPHLPGRGPGRRGPDPGAAVSTGVERLFLAVPLGPAPRAAIEGALDTAEPSKLDARFVPANNWHVTLRFLGDTHPATRARIEDELTTLRLPSPFRLR